MKAKIIADIAIIISFILFIWWWLISLPLPKVDDYIRIFGYEQTTNQIWVIIFNGIFFLLGNGWLFYKVIKWIHK